jgi:dTDP-4-dehydrorhamnose reductase
MNTVLVLGAGGYIGSYIYNFLQASSDFSVFGQRRKNGLNIFFDNKNEVFVRFKDFISSKKITHIIFAIGNASVDQSEIDPNFSYKTNYIDPTKYISVAIEVNPNIKIILLSSIYVFGDNCPRDGFSELDSALPNSVYGIHKKMLENYLEKISNNYIIARLPMIVGNIAHKDDYIKNTIEKILLRSSIPADDSIRFPTDVNWVSNTLLSLIDLDYKGFVHLSSNVGISKKALINYISQNVNGGIYENILPTSEIWRRPKFIKLISNNLPLRLHNEKNFFDNLNYLIGEVMMRTSK